MELIGLMLLLQTKKAIDVGENETLIAELPDDGEIAIGTEVLVPVPLVVVTSMVIVGVVVVVVVVAAEEEEEETGGEAVTAAMAGGISTEEEEVSPVADHREKTLKSRSSSNPAATRQVQNISFF